jgi:hypothetical protein
MGRLFRFGRFGPRKRGFLREICSSISFSLDGDGDLLDGIKFDLEASDLRFQRLNAV